MTGFPRIICALLVVLVASHGASSASMEQKSVGFVNALPWDSSVLNAGFAPRINLVAVFSCLQNYFQDVLKVAQDSINLVTQVREKVASFVPKFNLCSVNSPGIVENIKCKVGLVLSYARDAQNVYESILNINKTIWTLNADISKCIATGGPTPAPPTQPPPTEPPTTQPPTTQPPTTQPPTTQPPTTQPPTTQPPTTQPPTTPAPQSPSTAPPSPPPESSPPPVPTTQAAPQPQTAAPEAPAVPQENKPPQQTPIFFNKYFLPRN